MTRADVRHLRDTIAQKVQRLVARRHWVLFERLGTVGERLGNQLFEIAATYGIARRLGVDPIFPAWSYASSFVGPFPQRRFYHVPRDDARVFEHPYETGFAYQPFQSRTPMVVSGFYQSERYFEPIVDEIRRLFTPAPALADRLRRRHAALLAQQPWALHVRRGDYVGCDWFADLCATDYYERALGRVPPGTPVMVFSDDIGWTRERFPDRGFHFVEGQDEVEDLVTMSMAAGHIIANSSFSWWGAWIGGTPERTVIAPTAWFAGRFDDPNAPFEKFGFRDTRDLIPSRWHRI